MRAERFGAAAVISVAIGIVVYKTRPRPSTVAKADASASAIEAPSASTVAAAATTVVLIADLSEAGAPCGCGQIIRAVRAAGARGVPTKEIDPEKQPTLAAPYRALVTPTVLLLDGAGKELRRFEGEGSDVLAAMRPALEGLSSRGTVR
jgi:predicted RNA methylase